MNQKLTSAKYSDENEERYKALYENAPLPYQSLNEDGSFRDVNPAWLRTLGYEREEVVGKFFTDFLHPDWKAHFDENFPAFKKRGHVNDVQFKIRHKNGEYRDISFEGYIGHYPDGSFRQTYCVFQDITERKKTEQEIEASEKRYENLFNSISDAILVADTERKMIHCNLAFTDLFGYTENEIRGEDVSLIYPGLDVYKEVGEKIKENIRKQRVNLKIHFKKKNGEVFTSETSMFNLRNDKNELIGLIGIIRDITEQEKINLALKESEERWQFALEGNGDGIWDWDFRTDKVFFSNQWKVMLGYQTDEITNELDEWKKRVHPDDLAEALNDLDKHLKGETEIYQNEHRLLCKDGTYKWILDRGKILTRDAEGKPGRMIGIHTDIHKRKLAEFELKTIQFGIEHAEVGVYQIGEDGIINYANQYALKSVGYSKNELFGMSVFQIVPFMERQFFFEYRKKTKVKGSNTVIAVHRRKDGTDFPVEVTTSYFHYGDKSLSFSFVTDITERKKAEDELRELKDNLQIEVEEKTKELAERVDELERFQEATIEREFRMKELRDEIDKLKRESIK